MRVSFPPIRTPKIIDSAIGIKKEKLGRIPDFEKLYVFIQELKKINVKEVAITTCGGRNSKNVYRVGTMRMPPPTPKKDEKIPTINPVMTSPINIIDLSLVD